MKKGKLNLLIVLVLIGLGVSTYLTVKHFAVLTHGLNAPSFCSFSEKFDCDSVMMSDYGKLGPFPLGGLGLVYFLYLLFPVVYARIDPDSAKSTLAIPFLSTFPGLGFCIYLGYVSSVILKTYCIFCVSIYAITLGLFFLLRSILEVPFSEIGVFMMNYFKAMFGKSVDALSFVPRFFGNILYGLVLLAICLFILSATEKKYAADLEDFDHQAYLDFFYLQKPISIDTAGRPMWGRPGAPVTIVEFSDFECPYCKFAATNLKPRLREHQNDIAFYYFSYPLDKSCNPYMPRDLHEHACDASRAALCADAQGKFWAMHDKLFAHQPNFSHDEILDYAKKVGLDTQRFESCLGSDEIKQKIMANIEAGKSANLEGTPMILVNGRLLNDWLNPVAMNLVVEEEIRRAKQGDKQSSTPTSQPSASQTSPSTSP
jgi:protein-disulfide isomerase/uncharacterized membrane protein